MSSFYFRSACLFSTACLCIRLVVIASVFAMQAQIAAAQHNCPGANGDDLEPDDLALNECLAQGGTVMLNADVQHGYRIASGLTLSVNGTVLTSYSNWGYRALLYVVNPDLAVPILNVPAGTSGYQILNIWFYGNKYQRNGEYYCERERRNEVTNVALRGDGFLVDNVASDAAPCASSMSAEWSNFEIRNSWFSANGWSQPERPSWNEPWADGLTVLNCENGHIHNNHFIDNTDIDLVVGGGVGCLIENNTIEHWGSHGWGGLMAGSFPGYNGNHNGSLFTNNTVTVHTTDSLSFGIMVGYHPWDPWAWVSDPRIVSNSATGAVVNLAVDGVNGGEVQGNSMSGAAGSWGYSNCRTANNYTVVHVNGVSLQPGWVTPPGSCTW
jgi:hypothetical protein